MLIPMMAGGGSDASARKALITALREDMVETERAKSLGADFEERGEDYSFFTDVRSLGYKVWLDPSVKPGHIGAKVYGVETGAAARN